MSSVMYDVCHMLMLLLDVYANVMYAYLIYVV